MKKLYSLLMAAVLLFAAGCTGDIPGMDSIDGLGGNDGVTDDLTSIVDRIESLEGRDAALESLCSTININVSALRSLVGVIQSSDFVTGITPIVENGAQVGLTVTFSKAQPVTVYFGGSSDAVAGYKPTIGIA
ncbi:MAG: hypothetical protein J6R87_01205, partial [Rikenellaceae bacterium]|nr:hypothetical protein [Rikenellaceae bacterium]